MRDHKKEGEMREEQRLGIAKEKGERERETAAGLNTGRGLWDNKCSRRKFPPVWYI